MRRTIHLAVLGIVFVFAAFDTSRSDAQILTYELQPSATITRTQNGRTIYSAEPLSGTFQWMQLGSGIFKLINLSFSSPSFTIELGASFYNGSEFINYVNPSNPMEAEVSGPVNITGFSPPPSGECYFVAGGSYTGLATAPTSFTYLGSQTGIENGVSIRGLSDQGVVFGSIADTKFVAVLVPEPSTLALLTLAAVGFLIRRRC